MSGFATVLVANRGEIACRVIRSARRLGYRTVAVYSQADAGALHVRLADLATCIGPPPARESYLSIEAIVEAARRTGADAVHPGYGFLSESEAFARACAAAGLCFIGPPPEAIAAMGNKAAAKRRMIEAGVPTIPGWQGEGPEDQREAVVVAAAAGVGFPLLVKAAAGGGGRGMRLVRSPAELVPALRLARAEAESAFGSGEVLLERALLKARHVEVQVFGDQQGRLVHLGERDCSIQRRHQKIVEESPSPAVSTGLRARMGAAAVAAARSIGYLGAGTVEFLLDQDGAFYFLEMNTRLQVEHPVTECVTGLDLVALQLEVAAGRPLPFSQDQVQLVGHAIEVRLYAEDPYAGFLPQSGRVRGLWPGVEGAGLAAGLVDGRRVDHGLAEGQEVSPWYDPLLAKLIAHGGDREEARRRLLRLLEDTALLGTVTNKTFLGQVLAHPAFASGQATTAFVPTHFLADGEEAPPRPPLPPWALALGAALLSHPGGAGFELASSGETRWRLRLGCEGRTVEAELALGGGGIEVTIGGERTRLEELAVSAAEGRATVVAAGVRRTVRQLRDGARLWLDLGPRTVELEELPAFSARRQAAAGDGTVRALMNGRIVAVQVAVGAQVVRGQPLVVLEAMKMQHPLCADIDGRVAEVLVAEGEQVASRKLLLRIVAATEDER